MVRKIVEDKKKYTKWLPVRLKDDAILDRARTMSERKKEHDDIEARKAEEAREYTQQLTKLKNEITRLSNIIRTGEENQNVDCEESKDLWNKIVTVVRLDTGQIIEERNFRPHEAQVELKIEDGKSDDTIGPTIGEAFDEAVEKKKPKKIEPPDDPVAGIGYVKTEDGREESWNKKAAGKAKE